MNIQRVDCNELTKKNVNSEVQIRGFVHKIRKMGKVVFIDLRDIKGITQLIVESSKLEKIEIKSEYIINAIGKVSLRKDYNKNLNTGEIEIVVKKIEVISKSKQTPFLIKNNTDGLESLRLKYRYLDIRRPEQSKLLINRHHVISSIREYYNKKGFIEVETPILTKSTPEGARDFVVPSFNNQGKFYALPQSPQLYKQLLMIGGMEKYYQIVKCFRDETSRSDRQPEFTQLDIETSYQTQDEIINQTEDMMKYIFKKVLNINLKDQFIKITYDDAINNYGSDKPDLRFDLKIMDVTKILEKSEMNLFKNASKNNKAVKTLLIDNLLDKKQIKYLEDLVKKSGGKGLAYYQLTENDDYSLTGSVGKFINSTQLNELIKLKKHKTALFIIDENKKALEILGIVRYQLGRMLELVKNNDFNFVWVIDWPMFEKDEYGNLISMHHPFTKPQDKYTSLENSKAQAYDIVLNGSEIGGGSIRINDNKMQRKIFHQLGLSDSDIDIQFGFFMEAFEYSMPPHGGIAIGIDRMLSLMFNTQSIRDVIAFPKNSSGFSELEKSPSVIKNEQLNDLKIKLISK